MFNMMGSPYAMMEADAMTYGKTYRVRSRTAAAAPLIHLLRTILWQDLGHVSVSVCIDGVADVALQPVLLCKYEGSKHSSRADCAADVIF
jgi:hypothetical protein